MAQAKDIMTTNPTCCGPNDSIRQAAQGMAQSDCGELPVMDGDRLVGVITDRDICCRAVAQGMDPRPRRSGSA